MNLDAKLSVLVEFPWHHDGAAAQVDRLWAQLDLLGVPGAHPFIFWDFDSDNPPAGPEDLDAIALTDRNPQPLVDWLRAHGAEDLHDADAVVGIEGVSGSAPSPISWFFNKLGGSVSFRPDPDQLRWPADWRRLLIEMVEIWGAHIGVVSRPNEFYDMPRRSGPEQLAGLLSYVRGNVAIDPAIATTEQLAGGTLITARDTRPETIKAIRAQLTAQLQPAAARPGPATAAAPTPPAPPVAATSSEPDPADDYTTYITGVRPEADGSRLQLHIGEVTFPGYVNRAGADVYLRAIYLANLEELAQTTPEQFMEHWRARAFADRQAVDTVRPEGIIEYHCNDQVLATLLRDTLADTGVHVFYSPAEVAQ